MEKRIDVERIEKAVREILFALGDNPDEREGIKETPKRVAKMYAEIFEGMLYTNDDLVKMYDKCFDDKTGDLVTVQKIPIFSTCEHHMALMYNMKVSVGYIPNGKVIGLSKIARIADMCARRLQLQERIGSDIFEVLSKILNTKDVIVVIEGEHSCMTTRGIKKPGTVTKTACINGKFKDNVALRQEFYDLIS